MVTNCELVEMLGLTYLMRTIYLCHYIKIIAIYSSHSLCFVGINRLESTPYHQTLARREHEASSSKHIHRICHYPSVELAYRPQRP